MTGKDITAAQPATNSLTVWTRRDMRVMAWRRHNPANITLNAWVGLLPQSCIGGSGHADYGPTLVHPCC
ncbi:hypothetical protein PCANC_19619 [Puccinia coronata f. sp. avenae]|uniref:Uncharacterized protein n=1 Tax=Puccinia coronata f. sp. avenae TaxID=200324 RepID=A0A2N5U0R3_9BASI|nr:hypothetical protein PCANC_19619 [Puccinia coronata f. sp. avenae]